MQPASGSPPQNDACLENYGSVCGIARPNREISYETIRYAHHVQYLAWHGERDAGIANHTDPEQWRFYVVATRDLPENQKTMGLRSLKKISSVCDISDLKRTVEDKLDTLRL